MICLVKDCRQVATEKHHIQYTRRGCDEIWRRLCGEHHGWITRVQSHTARRQHRELSQKQRWFFWYRLINGEMKRPRKTHLDNQWQGNYFANS